MKKAKQSVQVLSTLALAASDARTDTLKSVILNTIFEKKEIAYGKLLNEISSLYHFEPYSPEVNSIIEELIDKGAVIKEKENIRLSDDQAKTLILSEAELRDAETNLFLNFKNFVTDTLERKLEISQIKLLYSVFLEYLYNSFYEFGSEALQNFVPGNKSTDVDNDDFIQEAYLKLKDKELCETFKVAIDKYPEHASREDLNFLNDISLKTQSFVSLGVKPEEVENIKEINPIDWILYLDTNVLFSLLNLHAHPENDSCKALIQLINDNHEILKIKLRYSDLTLKELTKKKNDFKLLDDKLSSSAITAMLRSDRLDEFSRQFYTNLLHNRAATIHPTKVIDLSGITLKQDGIEISRSIERHEKLGENFLNARTQDYLRWILEKNEVKQAYCKEKGIPFRENFRSDKQAFHDISLRELIIDFRWNNIKKTTHLTFNSVKYFAVTLDELLIQFDQYVRRNETDVRKYPVFFKPSFLLSKLVKVLPIKTDDYKKAYLKAVTSRGFNKDVRKSEDIQRIVNYLKQRGVDNDQVIYDLISQDLFLEKFRENETEQRVSNEQFIEDEINKQFHEKQKLLEQSKVELEGARSAALEKADENETLSTKVAELEKQALMYLNATKTLTKRLNKLEKAEAKVIPTQRQFDFEAAEKQKEIDRLIKELTERKASELKDKQDKYKDDIIRKWKHKSLIPLCIFIVTFVIFMSIHNWDFSFLKRYINKDTPEHIKVLLSLVFPLVILIINIFILGHIYMRYLNESNIKAKYDRIKLPEDLTK